MLGWQLYCHPGKRGKKQGWQYNCHPNNLYKVTFSTGC